MTLRERAAWLFMPLLGGWLGVVSIGTLNSFVDYDLPGLETFISPVVSFLPVDDITRRGNHVCFALHIAKLHAAVPIKYSFFVEARLSERIPVGAYLVDDHMRRQKNADLVTHPVGEHWTRRYCFDLPQTVADLDVRVTGLALHRRHPFYDTPTPIPSFNVLTPP